MLTLTDTNTRFCLAHFIQNFYSKWLFNSHSYFLIHLYSMYLHFSMHSKFFINLPVYHSIQIFMSEFSTFCTTHGRNLTFDYLSLLSCMVFTTPPEKVFRLTILTFHKQLLPPKVSSQFLTTINNTLRLLGYFF